MNILGIAGLARSGKDTFADYLLSGLPRYTKAAFADSSQGHVGLGLSQKQLYGDEKEIL